MSPRKKTRSSNHKRRSSPKEKRVSDYANAQTVKRAVWDGRLRSTSGGLTKKDLMLNKDGKVVSIKQHKSGKAAYKRHGLAKHRAKPFGSKRSRSRSRK